MPSPEDGPGGGGGCDCGPGESKYVRHLLLAEELQQHEDGKREKTKVNRFSASEVWTLSTVRGPVLAQQGGRGGKAQSRHTSG